MVVKGKAFFMPQFHFPTKQIKISKIFELKNILH